MHARFIDLHSTSAVRAHGGAGGGRCSATDNGHITDNTYADTGCNAVGRGGLSYWDTASSPCDGSGTIDFEEFVCAVWNICTCEGDAFVAFAFGLFDADASGRLDPQEVLRAAAVRRRCALPLCTAAVAACA